MIVTAEAEGAADGFIPALSPPYIMYIHVRGRKTKAAYICTTYMYLHVDNIPCSFVLLM